MKISSEPARQYQLPTAVLTMAISDDDATAYLGCMDGVYRVETSSGEHERIGEHASYVSGVALREAAGQLITAGYDGMLKWWDLASGKLLREVAAHQFWSWRMALSPDAARIVSVTGQYLAGGYKYEPAPEREPSVRVYDAESGELLQSMSHVPSVQSVAFSPDGQHIAAGNLMGEIRVWASDTGELIAQWTTDDFTSWGIIKSHCYIGGVFDLHFTPDGEHLLLTGMGPMRDPMAGNGRQTWQRFAWRETPAKKVQEYGRDEGLMESLAFTPDGKHFVMSGRLRGGDGNTSIFATESGDRKASLDSKYRVTKASFSHDSSQLWLAGTAGQPDNRDGKFPPFGRLAAWSVS